jgi:hypothetical protein
VCRCVWKDGRGSPVAVVPAVRLLHVSAAKAAVIGGSMKALIVTSLAVLLVVGFGTALAHEGHGGSKEGKAVTV